ncbi:serine protease inhibitor swm-1-like [Musca autumnalis]|uniref:serine protease inhibitor swm-1-like n=1 Tax=Musca autumnalis TaxID=221902 RepID=UPI003CEFBDE8
MSKFLVLFALVAVLAVSVQSFPFEPKECGVNEQYTACGSVCRTCEYRNRMMCPLMCFMGCECKEGLLRNSAGECVAPEDCYHVSSFPISCSERFKGEKKLLAKMSKFLIFFALVAVFAVAAVQSFPFEPIECGVNEEYTTCGTVCRTCEYRNSIICPMSCIIGCICKQGLLRNSAGECVVPEQC